MEVVKKDENLEFFTAELPGFNVTGFDACAGGSPPQTTIHSRSGDSLIAVISRASGEVVVEATLDSKGSVSAARVLEGHPLLRTAARQTIRQWQFEPEDGTEPRIIRLTLSYPEVRLSEPSERSYSVLVRPYNIRLAPEIHRRPGTPRIWSFVPEDWVPGSERCKVHRLALQKDRVPITYGLVGYRDGYLEAKRRSFPNSNKDIEGGCVIETEVQPETGKIIQISPQSADVLYCSRCRQDEARWSRKNRYKKLTF